MTEKQEEVVEIQEVTMKKENISICAATYVKEDMTNGDIFGLVREIQLSNLEQRYKIINSLEIYNDFIDYRNLLSS